MLICRVCLLFLLAGLMLAQVDSQQKQLINYYPYYPYYPYDTIRRTWEYYNHLNNLALFNYYLTLAALGLARTTTITTTPRPTISTTPTPTTSTAIPTSTGTPTTSTAIPTSTGMPTTSTAIPTSTGTPATSPAIPTTTAPPATSPAIPTSTGPSTTSTALPTRAAPLGHVLNYHNMHYANDDDQNDAASAAFVNDDDNGEHASLIFEPDDQFLRLTDTNGKPLILIAPNQKPLRRRVASARPGYTYYKSQPMTNQFMPSLIPAN